LSSGDQVTPMRHAPAMCIKLADVRDRARVARRVTRGLHAGQPALAGELGKVTDSLADITTLASDIRQLRRSLTAARLRHANLAAAGTATIAADLCGEIDPLSYLRDELAAQGFHVPGSQR